MYDEELVPDAELMESMRAIGYSLKTAVADLCDNSIAVDARNIFLTWQAGNAPFVYLLDDGAGMSHDTLRQAMKLAGKSPLAARSSSDLGRFGLGLKTASMSQARSLTVITKQGPSVNAAKWDLDYLQAQGKWSLQWLVESEYSSVPGYSELSALSTGTLVLWENLDQLLGETSLDSEALAGVFSEVAAHLGLVFHRYLGESKNPLHIFVNGKAVPTFDPFLEGEAGVIDRKATTVDVSGETVSVHPFILPSLSQMSRAQKDKAIFDIAKMREAQGFYVYRNKRLLTWGTWFRMAPMDELGRLARVRVDTGNALDSQWKLGIMKSTVQPPKALLDALKRLVPNIIENSSRAVKRKPAVQTNSDEQVWKIRQIAEGAFALEVNIDHPMLVSLFERLDGPEQRALAAYIDALGRYIPAEEIHGLLARDNSLQEGFQSDQEILQFAEVLFEQFQKVSSGDAEKAWEWVEHVEPFQSDIQLKSRLRAIRQGGKR